MADSLNIKLGITGADQVAAGIEKLVGATNQLKLAFAGIGAAMGLSSLGQAAIATARLGGQLSDLSARTGISTKSLIVLRQAFQDAGVGADAVGKSVSLLQKNIFEAATAGGTAASALSDMGLSAADLAQLAPEEQFLKVSKAIAGIENPAQRTAAAMAIFGKGAGELLPLFGDGGAIDSARDSLGKLPDVLSRNVPVLDSISDALDRLPNKATQLFAGIADQLAPEIKAAMDRIEKIDLTGLGQKIGATIGVGIDMWKKGEISQFISLSIGAGFELGMKKGKEWMDWLFSTPTANAIGVFTVTLVANVGKAFLDIDAYFRGIWHGMMIFASQTFVNVMKSAINFLVDGIESQLRTAAGLFKLFNPMAGKLIPNQISLPRLTQSNTTFDESMAEGFKRAENEASIFKATLDLLVRKYEEFFTGVSKGEKIPEGNLEKLDALMKSIGDRLRGREEQAAREATKSGGNNQPISLFNFKLELQKQELAYAQQMQALTLQKGKVEADWLMSSTEKYKQRKAILDAELATTVRQIQALQDLRARTNNPEEKQAIDQKLTGLQGQAGGLVNQIGGMGPDPTSYSQQFAAMFQGLQEQAAITARSVAQTFADVFNSAISSISNGITSLVMGTKSWGQALMEIGTSILTSIVGAIVQMGVRWIATQLLMAVAGKAIMASALAASAPIAAAQSAIWATPATLSTIASYGAAAAAAPGFIAASQGIVLAQSMAAFRTGGYTGDGDPNAVAGIVHRGEYVVPADAVDRIGVQTLEAIAGGSTPSAATATSASAPAPIVMNMGVFDDPRRLAEWARSNDGRTVLVDIMRQHAHEFLA